ncbi:Ankyrin repeat-containing protein, partial [Globisporangium splendens]
MSGGLFAAHNALIGHAVRVETTDLTFTCGVLYCIDPESDSVVLLNKREAKENDGKEKPWSVKIFMGHSVTAIRARSNEDYESGAVVPESLESIRQSLQADLPAVVDDGDQEALEARRGALCALLTKSFIPWESVAPANGKVPHIRVFNGAACVRPPFTAAAIECANAQILARLQQLLPQLTVRCRSFNLTRCWVFGDEDAAALGPNEQPIRASRSEDAVGYENRMSKMDQSMSSPQFSMQQQRGLDHEKDVHEVHVVQPNCHCGPRNRPKRPFVAVGCYMSALIGTLLLSCCQRHQIPKMAASGTAQQLLPRFVTRLHVVLRYAAPSFASLDHVLRAINTFVDDSGRWTIVTAAAKGFVHLLDYLAAHQEPHMDRHYRNALFTKGMIQVALSGDLDVAKWLHAYCPDAVVTMALAIAAFKGHLHILQWLHAHHKRLVWSLIEMDGAVERNHFDVVKWLHEHTNVQTTAIFSRNGRQYGRTALDFAARNGNLKMLQWLYDQEYKGGAYAVELAAENGHLETLSWLLEHRPHPQTRFAVALERAAAKGHLDIVKRLHTCFDGPCSRMAMESAAKGGHLELVEWLHEHRGQDDACTVEAMNHAAAAGHLATVQWLHANRTEGCTVKAMDEAASSGHFDVVQWLHCNRAEGCTTKAMDLTARNGHLNVLQWLHDNRSEGCTTDAMDFAAMDGHLEIVQWLHENRSEGCTATAMDKASADGHLDVVQFLHTHRAEGCTTAAMDKAAMNGHLEIVQWLHANRREGCTSAAMDGAAENGFIHILEWLHVHRREGCSVDAMDEAARRGHLKVVQWLHANRREGCTTKAMDNAIGRGDLDMVLLLHSHRSEGCTLRGAKAAAENNQLDTLAWVYENYPDRVDLAAIRVLAEYDRRGPTTTGGNHLYLREWLKSRGLCMDLEESLASCASAPQKQKDATSGGLLEFPMEDDPRWRRFRVDDDTSLSYAILTHDALDEPMPSNSSPTWRATSSSKSRQHYVHEDNNKEEDTPPSTTTTSFRLTVFLDAFQQLETLESFFRPFLVHFPRGKILLCGFPSKTRHSTIWTSERFAQVYADLLVYLMDTTREWLVQPKIGTIGDVPQYVVVFGTGAQAALRLLTIEIPLRMAKQSRLGVLLRAQRGVVLINGLINPRDDEVRHRLHHLQRVFSSNSSSEALTRIEIHEALLANLFSEYYLTQVAPSRQAAMETFFQTRRSQFVQGRNLALLRLLLRGSIKSSKDDLRDAPRNLSTFVVAPFALVVVHGAHNALVPASQAELLCREFPQTSMTPSLQACLGSTMDNSVESNVPQIHVAWLKSGHEVLQERLRFIYDLFRQLVLLATPESPQIPPSEPVAAKAAASETRGSVTRAPTATTQGDTTTLTPRDVDNVPDNLNTELDPTEPDSPTSNMHLEAKNDAASRVKELLAQHGLKWIQQELYDRGLEGSGTTAAILQRFQHALEQEDAQARAQQAQKRLQAAKLKKLEAQ